MVIDEARRTYTYLGLFGYGVDGVVVNRVLPEEISDPYFAKWLEIQKAHLDTVDAAFREVPRMRLRLFDDEMVGIEQLRQMADELYEDADPIAGYHARSPFRVLDDEGMIVLEMDVPFVDKSELDVFRHGVELYVEVGPYRRSFVLPDSLQRRDIAKASFKDSVLRVSFGAEAKR
jgi:arsenite-transporting ATPase